MASQLRLRADSAKARASTPAGQPRCVRDQARGANLEADVSAVSSRWDSSASANDSRASARSAGDVRDNCWSADRAAATARSTSPAPPAVTAPMDIRISINDVDARRGELRSGPLSDDEDVVMDCQCGHGAAPSIHAVLARGRRGPDVHRWVSRTRSTAPCGWGGRGGVTAQAIEHTGGFFDGGHRLIEVGHQWHGALDEGKIARAELALRKYRPSSKPGTRCRRALEPSR